MIRLLLAEPGFTARTLPALRTVINSSAPIDPATYVRLKDRFAGVEVLNSYGLTEASTCTLLPDTLARTRAESVGAPIEGVEMCVQDPEGRILGPGEEGEICVRGPHVFLGYRDDPDATAHALRGGWLHTGDLGTRDEQGLYVIAGRLDDVINCGGHKVLPEYVEQCIRELPGVSDAAVSGMPHRLLGEVVQAWVVGEGIESRAVVRHCASRLPSHMVPFRVTLVPALPRNAVGKLQRGRLRMPDAAAATPEARGS